MRKAARSISPGMGQAVAERTILRRKDDGAMEVWEDVARRVAKGNTELHTSGVADFDKLFHHLAAGNTLLSGRHLQHGDSLQWSRPMEVFTNCSTAPTSFLSFYLLLNGSGVGRCFDSDLMLVNWDHAPTVRCVIDESHPDFDITIHESKRDALHKFGTGSNVIWHEVADSREGWAKALEIWELLAFEKIHAARMLILDFSKVRGRGSPILGMQGRPSSGPAPLMGAFAKALTLKGAGITPFKQNMCVDHYFAECVLVGGARRSARMSVMHWLDPNIFQFITIKQPIEYYEKTVEEIQAIRAERKLMPFLWSSNNSVTVDKEFWSLLGSDEPLITDASHARWTRARTVFKAITETAYSGGTGEPGIINADLLVQNDAGWTDLNRGDYVGSAKFQVEDETQILLSKLAKRAKKKKHHTIVNPCVPGDTPILTSDGYANIQDLVGNTVDVWNGKKWVSVTPFSTGYNPTVTVLLSNGVSLRVTPTHEFILAGTEYIDRKEYRTAASALKDGDKLFKYLMPTVEGGVNYETDAYSQGFYSGDGCTNNGTMLDKSFVPINGSLSYCLNWFAGVADSDGTIHNDAEGGQSLCISSVDEKFLLDIRLMLTRLGVQAHVSKSYGPRSKFMPDGKGGKTEYDCLSCYRLVVCGYDLFYLHGLGIKFERLVYLAREPQRSAARFIKVVSVLEAAPCETFCFTEEENHTGTFNGIVTGQCGEIPLNVLGGFCVIADNVPFHCDTIEEAEDAIRHTTRALIRVNLMNSIYDKEVKRTNRIGVGLTGVHEFAWKFFGYGFYDLIDEEKSMDFWLTLRRLNRVVYAEAQNYCRELGVPVPHTMTTVKPSGSVSKLFGLTEGWHLPSMRKFLRWVQFRSDDPLVEGYKKGGYPSKDLTTYSGTTIIGFPTVPTILTLGMGDKLVTASEATPEEQFQWLRLGEKYWIEGTDPDNRYGGQISYTLKYDPKRVDFVAFRQMLLDFQAGVRCCSVMPQEDASAYEYQPEEPISDERFDEIVASITLLPEDIGREHLECAGGVCPIDFNQKA